MTAPEGFGEIFREGRRHQAQRTTREWDAVMAKIEREAAAEAHAAGECPYTDNEHSDDGEHGDVDGFVRVATWAERPIPERTWGVPERVPARNVTLLSGEGGVGKTLVVQQLAVATVLDFDWLGARPAQGPFMGLFCEDDKDELHRRFAKIAQHYGADLADLENLHVESRAAQDAILGAPDRTGIIQPTELFFRLMRDAKEIKPKIFAIDNAADVYAGNENDRAQVRQFIGLLRRLAQQADTCVLLTSHPSLTGVSTGTGLSGSTAWNASVRSRLYLRKPKPEGDEQPDPEARILECMKSNYGPTGECIDLRWADGVFALKGGAHWLDKRAVGNAADALFLRLLARFDAQGRNCSHVKSAPTYAPAMFAKDPEASNLGMGKRALSDAMDRLFAANGIHVMTYGRPSRPATKIAVGPHP